MAIDIEAPGANEADLKAALRDLGMPVLIQRQTSPVSGAFLFTGLDFSPYSLLEVSLSGIMIDADAWVYMQVEIGGVLYTTASYRYHALAYTSSATGGDAAVNNATGPAFPVNFATSTNYQLDASASASLAGEVTIYEPNSSALVKHMRSRAQAYSIGGNLLKFDVSGGLSANLNPLTGFKIYLSTGNITAGGVSLFGRK